MESVAAPLPRRERAVILAALLVLAASAWAFLVAQSRLDGGGGGLTMGSAPVLFLGVWVVMMVAMMFPTAAPMVLTFARVGAARRQRGAVFVPTWVFVAAYLIVWTGYGSVAYALAAVAQGVAESSPWVMANAARIGGATILLAGAYQLSPLKQACLAKCRSPLAFVMRGWREGYTGALRMGLEHGVYCLGCCWLLFVLLFPLGVMNVWAMAAITALIFVEKSWYLGPRARQVAAWVLIAYGMLVIVVPDALPTPMPMAPAADGS